MRACDGHGPAGPKEDVPREGGRRPPCPLLSILKRCEPQAHAVTLPRNGSSPAWAETAARARGTT